MSKELIFRCKGRLAEMIMEHADYFGVKDEHAFLVLLAVGDGMVETTRKDEYGVARVTYKEVEKAFAQYRPRPMRGVDTRDQR